MEHSGGNPKTWVPPGNLCIDNPGWRTPAEKKELIYRLNLLTLRAADPSLKMKGDQISAILGYVCSRSSKKIFVIDTLFSASHYSKRNPQGIKAYNHIRGKKYMSDYEAFLVPVIVYNDPTHTNEKTIHKKVGHWCIGIYVRETNEMHYLDPYGHLQGEIKPHVKTILHNSVNTVTPNQRRKIVPKIVFHKELNEHNTQPFDDGESCGYFDVHIAIQFLNHGINGLYDPNFDLNEFKKNVVLTIKALLPLEEPRVNYDAEEGEIEVIPTSHEKIIVGNDEVQILPIPLKKAKLMPDTPTVALNLMSLTTPTVTNNEIDLSFLPDNLKGVSTPKKKPSPKNKPKLKALTVTSEIKIKISSKKGRSPKTEFKMNFESEDTVDPIQPCLSSTVEPMEIDLNSSAVSEDFNTKVKSKKVAKKPEKLSNFNKKNNEVITSAAEMNSDSTIASFKSQKELIQLNVDPMHVDSSAVSEDSKTNAKPKKGGRPKKAKRSNQFTAKKSDVGNSASESCQSDLMPETTFTNKDGSKVSMGKHNDGTQLIISGEIKKSKTSQELMPPPSIIPILKKAEKLAKRVQEDSDNDADCESIASENIKGSLENDKPPKKVILNRYSADKREQKTIHKIGLSTVITASEFPPPKITIPPVKNDSEQTDTSVVSENSVKKGVGRPKKTSYFKGKSGSELKSENNKELSDSSVVSESSAKVKKDKGGRPKTDKRPNRFTSKKVDENNESATVKSDISSTSVSENINTKRPSKRKQNEIIVSHNAEITVETVKKSPEKMEIDKSKPKKVLTAVRTSARLQEHLPKCLPIHPRCHYDGQIHAEGCAAISVNHEVESNYVGNFDKQCPHCKAYRLQYELETPKMANKCCALGEVHTEQVTETYDIIQKKMPKLILQLSEIGAHPNNKEFVQKSILINSLISFGTISTGTIPRLPANGPPCKRLNGDISHTSSGLVPPDGMSPKFGQVYCIDLSDALIEIGKMAQSKKINEELLRVLHEIVRDNHVYSKLFKNGSERLAEAIADAAAKGKEIPRFRLTIVDAREEQNFTAADPSVHPHRAEKPRNELVGMIWCNDDGDPPEYNGVWLHGTEGETEPVPYWSPNVDALCYCLLFPYGNQMYRNGLIRKTVEEKRAKKQKKNVMNEDTDISDGEVERHINGSDEENDESILHDSTSKKKGREYISRKEFYRYQMYPRNNKDKKNKDGFKEPHWLWSKGQLADAYLIDILCRAERCDLAVAKKKIENLKLRFTSSEELRKYVQKNYLKEGTSLGNLFTIPMSFKGGRKYMQKAYADIMTIIDNTDLPSWFITFTGNPHWPEIKENIGEGENRSDVKCRVFMAKAQEFLDDLFKRHVMGKVRAYHVVMEFQKRGMPHLHVILIMDKRVGVDEVDNYVSARIPKLPDPKDKSKAANQMRRLHDIIVKNNLHLCNANSACFVNGICTKGFRKPFSQTTVIHTHKPPEYTRLPPKPDDFDEKQAKIAKAMEEQNAESASQKSDEKANVDIKEEVISDSEEFNNLPDVFVVDEEPSETQKFEDDEQFHYFDEVRKDLEVSQVEYKRLPPPPKELKINESNEHLFGNTYEKKTGRTFIQVDDSYVVPYNPFLSLKYDCHINVECTVGQQGSPKYTCKYTTKLGDVIYAKVNRFKKVQKDKDGKEIVDFNEGEQHILARIMTGCEAWMRLNNTWIIKQSHIVETLHIHLEGDQMVYFEEGSEEQAAEKDDKSQLIAFFKLCANDENARQYTYNQIPHFYRYDKTKGIWIKRKIKPSKFFVRVHHVPPKNTELYALRVLLTKVKGPKSFKDLRTVGEKLCPSFVEAAKTLGYWENDEIHIKIIAESISQMRSIRQKKHFIAMVIAHNQPANANTIINTFLEDIFTKPQQKFEGNEEKIRFKALCYLEYIFKKMDTSCKQLGIEVPDNFYTDYDESEAHGDFEAEDELMIDNKKVTFEVYAEHQKANLNPGQGTAFNRIWDAILHKIDQKFFFLQGSGGTGKTHVYNTLIDYCRLKGKKVLACASTGIAATLLRGGMTAHSALYVPTKLDKDSKTRIEPQTEKGKFIKELDFLIIDEVSMLHKDVLKYIDSTLKTIRENNELFGGVVVLIGGDWKQLTPVVRNGQPSQIIEASVKSWDEFQNNVEQLNLTQNMRVKGDELQFVEELKQVGNGEVSKFIPGTNSITIDSENVVKTEKQLINFCYEPEWLENPEQYIEQLCGSAILCPKNTAVQRMNESILSQLQGNEKVFYSTDTVISDKDIPAVDGNLNEYSIEAMHKIETAGMPPHELKLKVGAIVMLIKNLSVFTGLCNGTRMQVVGFNDTFVKCKLLTGSRSRTGEIIFLPLCKFEYGKDVSEPGIHFTRTQFPIKLSFAISINKAQGQTLNRVGLYFGDGECFSHGQLYTAMSRVRTKLSLRILPSSSKNTCVNIVYKRLLD